MTRDATQTAKTSVEVVDGCFADFGKAPPTHQIGPNCTALLFLKAIPGIG